ncbi:CHAT domain-containing protein [Candidatus Aalborgicola defluviihabitans]|uniref:CHAT domain-containing protein n=1 Tax=Candidatus Aalborgicola defluviihabitans TaxID=3386187 RepID=UPI001D9F8ACA|nr:CHAT domain-containing protein [Burkholderiales bacterium]
MRSGCCSRPATRRRASRAALPCPAWCGASFAGARSVLATHWAVESESATALTSATFSAQGKGTLSRGESLRQAQLAMLDGKLGNGRWSHPFYWAPYALFGDPVR